jgi:hypothetical protein
MCHYGSELSSLIMAGGCPPLTKRVVIFDGVAKPWGDLLNTNVIHYVLDGGRGLVDEDDVGCLVCLGDMHTRCSNMGLEILKLHASHIYFGPLFPHYHF